MEYSMECPTHNLITFDGTFDGMFDRLFDHGAGRFKLFWSTAWNVFDFVVVLSSLLTTALDLFNLGEVPVGTCT